MFNPLKQQAMSTKHRILETLFSTNNSLTREEIAWAVENIPAESNSFSASIPFDHTQDTVYAACGINEEEMKECGNEYVKLKSDDFDKRSQFVEHVVAYGSPRLIRSLIIRGIQGVEEKKMDDLKELLDLMKKLK
jgi:hypothetical protein